MTTKLITNAYKVTFVFEYATISTFVFAMHEDAAPDLAALFIADELGIGVELLDQAQDISVELMDEDVL